MPRAPRLRLIKTDWWLLATCWIATASAIVFWLTRTPNPVLRDELRRWQFWGLETQFILLVFLSGINLPSLVRLLKVRRQDVMVPAAAAALAFALATWLAPQTSRIYYDEQIYQGIGQNFTDLRLAQMCHDGNVENGRLECRRGEYNKQPYAYPYLLSVAYRLVGVREGVAFAMNTMIVSLMVVLVFLITTALTRSPRAGGYAALIAALIPEQLRWSHSASSEPAAATACACAVLTALAFVHTRSMRALLWMVVATAFAVQFRPESVLIVPVVGLVVVLYAPDELARPRVWWAGLLALLLTSLHLGHLVAVSHEGWGTPGDRFSLAYVVNNLRANGLFYLWDGRFPFAYSILAVTALVSWFRHRALAVPAVYFVLFWGIFLFFYAGSYNYGADDRYSLMTYPPLAIAAGIGAWRIAETSAGVLGPRSRSRAGAIIVAALGVQFLWNVPLVKTTGEEAWGARADVAFARSMARELPAHSIVLTHNPHMFHLWGHSAAQVSLVTKEPGYADNLLPPRYGGGVFFHWNFWCNIADPVQQGFCKSILARFPATLVREYRERDYRYALYRLDTTPFVPDPLSDD